MSTDKRVMVIDCQSAGISGDMVLGALLDLGANLNKMNEAMKCVQGSLRGCKSLNLTAKEVRRKGFRAKKVDVDAIDEASTRTGRELKDALNNSIRNLRLSSLTAQLAAGALDTLIRAEAGLHDENIDEVHLHEAGSADTIADIIGTAVALEDLNLSRDTMVYSTPIAVGGGLLTFSHGTVSTPAPATLEILRSKAFPMIGGPVEAELATPTGVSLLVNMAHSVGSLYPPMKPTRTGYGAGTVDYPETPNLLRMVIGEPFEYAVANDEVHVLETNLDDISGEVIGYVVDRLLEAGAKDVSIIPMFTKKNRPGHIVKIISDKKDVKQLVRILVDETGTLGVREYPCGRHILLREISSVNVVINEKNERVRVKIAKDANGRVVQVKPEYDDIERLAKESGTPFRAIMEIATKRARSLVEKES